MKRYQELAQIHANTDYGDSRSVKRSNDAAKRSNDAADEMADICRRVAQIGARGLEDFATLLDESANKTQLWAAHHILEHTEYGESMKASALRIIQEYSKGEDATGYGEKLWLQEGQAKDK